VKEGFAEGVRELEEAGVFVMPYINGRLWDTRDKGTERTRPGGPKVKSVGSRRDQVPVSEWLSLSHR